MNASSQNAPVSRRALLGAAGAVVLLAAGSTVAVAAASGAFRTHGRYYGVRGPSCAAPALPGTTVSVQLVDMRSTMTRGGMMGGGPGGYGGMMRQGDWRYFHRGMMRVVAAPAAVSAGVVSLKVTNAGYLTHELVVLPLAAGQQVGSRAVGSDGTVDETGSYGEASATCAGGEGDGIAAGSTGWVRLRLPAGRYELVCNLPGHYAAGMYAELDVN